MTGENIEISSNQPLHNATRVKEIRINHPRVIQVAAAVKSMIYPGSQDSLVVVTGPSGVGKTSLSSFLVEEEVRNSKEALEADAGTIPAIYIEADASGEKEFSWRLFYQRILHALGSEIAVDTMEYGINPSTGLMLRPKGASRNTLASLRTAVERALRARKTKFIVVDEAAHIINQCRSSQMLTQFDALKSLANRCGSQIILVGAYDLHKLVSLSAQLSRRTYVVHFERYRRDNAEDWRAFQSTVRAFEKKFPQLWGDNLMPYVEDLYANSLGCIGTLSGILTRAANIHSDKQHWKETLQNALYTHAQVNRMLEEIKEGELEINPSLCRG